MIKNKLPETTLRTSDFYYELPNELIAQTPIEPRDHSRLMVLKDGNIEHKHFYDIIDYLKEGDTLVINDSRVIPARIYGEKVRIGDDFVSEPSKIEMLLLKQRENERYEVLLRPAKKIKLGGSVRFGDILTATVEEIIEDGNRIVSFSYDKNKYSSIFEVLDIIGSMPLPPYITKKLEDKNRYQTVYARENGSAAAPTAGLHFTKELLEKIEAKGVKIVPVMLHVGLGTFRPVKEDSITDHIMHTEYIEVTKQSADIINERRRAGGRIIAVGTTSCRTLESAADESGTVHPVCDDTGIFIFPGYKFKAVDALITNFHLPESTLLMLVSAFYGKDGIMNAYKCAVDEKYRFFSFGDAMLIHPQANTEA
ncbi:MAG: tRNA preQ1(34) S-adenosylmethionine ribosyltransferase-isomerase QueA [Clostridia bacterium]|nr:tRNA preQ1(34) S-adenosylmethionine ribosyltransferase-isomerase QueA [Clostridia bacterium]MBO5416025.1 tRNA preQ1(34) S-adenosylmethionine ribosyltransferase-isomerase QueA [Clostridia bacterium]